MSGIIIMIKFYAVNQNFEKVYFYANSMAEALEYKFNFVPLFIKIN